MERDKPKIIQELEKEILKYNPNIDFSKSRVWCKTNSKNEIIDISVSSAPITNIKFLKAFPKITSFYSYDTHISDIKFLRKIPSIKSLSIGKSLVKDISLIETLKLKYLDVSACNVINFSPCDNPYLKHLTAFDCNLNQYLKLFYISRLEMLPYPDNKGNCINSPFSWILNQDINILIGNNGTGKSTILNIIYYILRGMIYKKFPDYVLGYILTINSNEKLTDDEYGGLTVDLNGKLYNIKNDITLSTTINKNSYPNVTFIKTFDTELLTQEVARKISDERIKTKLDYELYQWTTEFRRYDARLSKRLEKLFLESSPEVDLRAERQKLYATKTYFIDTVNRLFGKTGKILEITPENDIFFRVNGTQISPYELSSGEKQMLIIMFSVLIQDNQPHVLLMDEPESSLHLDWQEQLIEILRKLNPNCQLIIATHAPAIIQEGYWDYVTDIEDIIKPANEVENE